MVDVTRILIVGGGIAGLSTAIALRRQGFAVEIVEARPDWSVAGAAITLHGNGVRALRELGVGAALDAAAAVVPTWTVLEASGRQLCTTDLSRLWDGVAPCLGVTRARLHRILHDAAADTEIRVGIGLTSAIQHGTQLRVGFTDGLSKTYDLVVGADGVGSIVRRLLVAGDTPRDIGVTGWRSVAQGRPAGVTGLTLVMGDGCFFGLVPVGDGATYGFAGRHNPRADDPLLGRLDRLRATFAHFGGPIPHYLSSLHCDAQLHSARVRCVQPRQWHVGRAVLVGDAAHAVPPHLGEGGAMAVEDALVLAAELRQGDSVAAALAGYEARRRPRVTWVADQSLAAARAWATPPADRDALLRECGDQLLQDRYRPLRASW